MFHVPEITYGIGIVGLRKREPVREVGGGHELTWRVWWGASRLMDGFGRAANPRA